MENLTPEQEIALKSGFGEVDIKDDTTPELKEDTEDTVETEEADTGLEEKPKDDNKTTEPEEGKEVKKSSEEIKRTVPYGRLKAEIEKRKEVEQDISAKVAEGVKEALASLIKADNKNELPDAVKKAAQELAEETGFDEVGVEKLLRKAKELSKENEMPNEVKEKLDKLDKLEKLLEEQKAQADTIKAKDQFNGEWENFIPKLKKQYPNLSDSMLKEAKDKMDELAHTEAHHTHEIDYILFKNKDIFDTLLKTAPKSKGGEIGKDIHIAELAEEDDRLADIEDLTPEIMRQREKREIYNRSVQRKNNDYQDMKMYNPIK